MKKLIVVIIGVAITCCIVVYSAPLLYRLTLSEQHADSFFASEDCLASDKLRVKLGKHTYAIPRENSGKIYPIDPYETIDIRPEKLCQRPSEPAFEVRTVRFKIGEVIGCGSKPDCEERNGISVTLYKSGKKYEPYNLSRLQKECIGNTHFGTCRHRVLHRDLRVKFMYYLDEYPLKELENTIQRITKELDSYVIE